MIGHSIHLLHCLLWAIGNLRRRFKKPPDYVVLVLEGAYPELRQQRAGFFRRRIFPGIRISLQELGEQFDALQQDPRIKGVILHLRSLHMPAAHAQTLRGFVANLRLSGKRVLAWSTSYDNLRYYVATAADEILIQTGGAASPIGLRSTAVYLGDALERIGVKADFVQISPYKAAADPLMRSDMSDEVREMSNWLIDSYYDDFVQAIALGRNIEVSAAQDLVDGAPYTDLMAVEAGVVDRLISEEDLPAYLGDTHKPARLATWDATRVNLLRPPPIRGERYVALIRIEGIIVDGRSQRPPSGSPLPVPLVFAPRAGDLSVVQEARIALADRRAAAVVVYVDSTGGSATASEAIAAALQKVAVKKPLVAVMGPVAASGGYYVCTPAQWITAQPGTLTGSIGVVSGKLVATGLLDNLLFHRESIVRGLHADFGSTDKPFNENELKIVRDNIQRVYNVFLDRVTASRHMSREVADGICGGRVWTGSQAWENGLVDELGGLETGLAKARQLAGLNPRAPVHEVHINLKQVWVPVPDPSTMVHYAWEGLNMLAGGKPLCLCTLVPTENHPNV